MEQQHHSDILRMLEEAVSAEKKEAASIIEHFHECRTLGIEILPLDINLSATSCVFERDNALRLGFSALGYKGQPFLNELLTERQQNGPFQSFQDFCERIESEGVPDSFFTQSIKAGIFDSLGDSRARLLAGFEHVVQAVRRAKAEKAANQISLFAMLPADSQPQTLSIRLPEAEAWSAEEQIDYEKEALGFSFFEYLEQLEEEPSEAPEESVVAETADEPEAVVESGSNSEELVSASHTKSTEERQSNESVFEGAEESAFQKNTLPASAKEPPLAPEISEGSSATKPENAPEPSVETQPESEEVASVPDVAEERPHDASVFERSEERVLPEELPAESSDEEPPFHEEEHLVPDEPGENEPPQGAGGSPPMSPPDEPETPSATINVCLQLPSDNTTEAQLLQLRALCEKYPGTDALCLEFRATDSQRTAKVRLGKKYYIRDNEAWREEIHALFENVNILCEKEESRQS